MMSNKKGFFITLEGVEGGGKSTAMQFIKEYLIEKDIDFIITREPGGTIIAEDIRKIILSHYSEPMNPYTELLLYFASRAQHFTQVILPALLEGKCVVSDRFTDASYAYQGVGRNIPKEHISALENWILEESRPDVTLILDVAPEVGLFRTRSVGNLDRIESEELDFFERIRRYYLECVEQNPKRYKLIDAMQSIDNVKEQILKILELYLCEK